MKIQTIIKSVPWVFVGVTVILLLIGSYYSIIFNYAQTPEARDYGTKEIAGNYYVLGGLATIPTFFVMLGYWIAYRTKSYLIGLLLPLPWYILVAYVLTIY